MGIDRYGGGEGNNRAIKSRSKHKISIELRVARLGSGFKGRLEQALLSNALEYIQHGEVGLSLEILCDHLCELDISISEPEFLEILSLAVDCHLNLEAGRFSYLKKLTS